MLLFILLGSSKHWIQNWRIKLNKQYCIFSNSAIQSIQHVIIHFSFWMTDSYNTQDYKWEMLNIFTCTHKFGSLTYGSINLYLLHTDAVVRFESLRALKLTLFKSFRALFFLVFESFSDLKLTLFENIMVLKLNHPIWEFKGPNTLITWEL